MMPAAAIAPTEAQRRASHLRWHRGCFACGEGAGLGLRFQVTPDGGVATEWDCPEAWRSYPGVLHGGIIATLLDCAMVHALFAHGLAGRTAELSLRYRRPVQTGGNVRVTARLTGRFGPLCALVGEVRQTGALCATAHAKFMVSAEADGADRRA